MPSVQDFLVLLVVVLLLMILYFLMELARAAQQRVTADNTERRAVTRLEFIRNVQGRRRNRPTENDESPG